MKSSQPLVVIVGQTGSGKSDLAMRIARAYDGEIICADSVTVYKGLDIGSAKPTRADQKLIRHHLLDVADRQATFTVADFKQGAEGAISDIRARGKLPIVAGLSGLYVDSLLFNYQFSPTGDPEIRRQLEELDIEQLQALVVARQLPMPENSRNKRYLVRTLENARHVRSDDRRVMRSDTLVVGLHLDRQLLESRLRQRILKMMDEGLLDEVRRAHQIYPTGSEALKGNAYQIFKAFVDGHEDLQKCVDKCVHSDLRLAKKSYNWFKRNPKIHWFDSADLAYNFLTEELQG